MQLLDEEGRVLGLINVLDAVVVLFLLSALIAGIAVVMEDNQPRQSPPETVTTAATISYSAPLGSQAVRVSSGDILTRTADGSEFTVTDAYYSFTPDGDVHVVAGVRYTVESTGDGSILLGGDTIELSTGSYRITADVLEGDGTGSALERVTTPIVLEGIVTRGVANTIEPGDRATVSGTEVATVTSVERTSANGSVQIRVGLELTAWDREPVPMFGGQGIRVGVPLTIVTDKYLLSGHVTAVDGEVSG